MQLCLKKHICLLIASAVCPDLHRAPTGLYTHTHTLLKTEHCCVDFTLAADGIPPHGTPVALGLSSRGLARPPIYIFRAIICPLTFTAETVEAAN